MKHDGDEGEGDSNDVESKDVGDGVRTFDDERGDGVGIWRKLRWNLKDVFCNPSSFLGLTF